MRKCDDCGREFAPARADAAYCSSACRQRAYRGRIAALFASHDDPVAERRLQEAEYINVLRDAVRPLLDPGTVSTYSPKALDHLLATFEDVVRSIRNARPGVTDRESD